jgi:hypothetical protein
MKKIKLIFQGKIHFVFILAGLITFTLSSCNKDNSDLNLENDQSIASQVVWTYSGTLKTQRLKVADKLY